ncbi:TPA_asm: hypothetical protein GBY29_15785 [Salmonella enterica subsp. diarizonae]|uniref:Uncharacterized protein n=1 Tax=Salmonella diarizonae TaxID=59204 RepID=A0A6Y1UGK7_SALDZ|nr:hypothetical protein [Salmonella enterica]HAB4051244.1 hypothetical protein [Salmonella enterica subsp. diarizonae]
MKNRQNFFNRLKWQHIDHFFNTNAGLMRVYRPLCFTAVIIDFFVASALVALPPVSWLALVWEDLFNGGNCLKSLKETKRKRMRKDG